jgi:hypothetical protein
MWPKNPMSVLIKTKTTTLTKVTEMPAENENAGTEADAEKDADADGVEGAAEAVAEDAVEMVLHLIKKNRSGTQSMILAPIPADTARS